MFQATQKLVFDSEEEQYHHLCTVLSHIIDGERDAIANMANAAALLYHQLQDINWAGFYRLMEPSELVLGPFHGQPACIRIAVGRGVCGTAIARQETLVVPDVRTFAGHIACDAASLSEIVVPLSSEGRPVGVLDIDSPSVGRFSAADKLGLEEFARILVNGCDWQ